MSLKHLDLFTGIGGFKIAAEWAGFDTVAFCEINDWCDENALKANWPDTPNLRDITKLCRRVHHNLDETGQHNDPDYDPDEGYIECSRCSGKDYRNGGRANIDGWIDFGDCECIGSDEFIDTFGGVDLITAGVPCQPASIIGKRKGLEDSRWLWPDTFRVIEELEPTFVVCENPPGILTLDSGDRFAEIIERFQEAGYGVWWETIPASAVGGGHRRERVWLVAYSCGKGLEGHAGNGYPHAKSRREFESAFRPTPPKTVFPLRDSESWWKDQFPLPVVVDGVPDPAFYK